MRFSAELKKVVFIDIIVHKSELFIFEITNALILSLLLLLALIWNESNKKIIPSG